MAQLEVLEREATSRKRNGAILTAAAVTAMVLGGGWFAAANLGASDEPVEPTAPTLTIAAAEEVARGFLDAYNNHDADRALSYVNPSSFASPDDLRHEIAWNVATGYQEILSECAAKPSMTSTVFVRCDFAFHGLGSEEMGRGPYGDNFYVLAVRDGKIESDHSTLADISNGFSAQMWEPFAEWVSTTYPEDVALIDEGFAPAADSPWMAVTEESIPLWEQRTREFVAAVQAGTVTLPTP